MSAILSSPNIMYGVWIIIKIHFVYLEREPVMETGWPVRA